MSDTPQLDRAYALRTPDDSRKLYGEWAATYDSEFVSSTGYILHLNTVAAFVDAGGDYPVLDIGAGTGACGQAFAQLKKAPVDGTDISAQMLEVAAAKSVYRRVFVGDVLAGLDMPDNSYAGVVSAGTFTLGHVGPDGLDEVVRILRPEGLAVIAVRDAHYDAAGFDAKLRALEPLLYPVDARLTRIYSEQSTLDHANDKAVLLHLRKR